MGKSTLFGLLALMGLLGGCFSQPVENTSSTIETSNTLSPETGNVISTGTMSGDSSLSGTIHSGTLHSTQPVKDIVGETIPKGKDIGIYLSEYLSGEGLTGKIIGKKLIRDNIIAISMADLGSNGNCGGYMSTDCISFIVEDNKIIWSNAKPIIETTIQCKIDLVKKSSCQNYAGDGQVYRFTKYGVLFMFGGGEGVACEGGGFNKFTYINLKEGKPLYSVSSWQDKGISPDPKDDMCENKNTKWTKTETLKFYKSNEDRDDESKALPIKAKTTEEAFYKYYKLPQPKS